MTVIFWTYILSEVASKYLDLKYPETLDYSEWLHLSQVLPIGITDTQCVTLSVNWTNRINLIFILINFINWCRSFYQVCFLCASQHFFSYHSYMHFMYEMQLNGTLLYVYIWKLIALGFYVSMKFWTSEKLKTLWKNPMKFHTEISPTEWSTMHECKIHRETIQFYQNLRELIKSERNNFLKIEFCFPINTDQNEVNVLNILHRIKKKTRWQLEERFNCQRESLEFLWIFWVSVNCTSNVRIFQPIWMIHSPRLKYTDRRHV